MGRLFKPVSNGRARLMIEVAPSGAIQNPAYRFAADKMPFPAKQEGVIFVTWIKVFVFLYKLIYLAFEQLLPTHI
jgi:hypothetical protein